MEETRILMVVKEPEARLAYEETLGRVGVHYHTAEDFKEVLRMTIDGAYSGLLVDILTLIRSSKEEKTIAYDCINFYPTLRMKWDARQKSISCSPQEHALSADTEGALTHFIEKRCKSFSARSLRRFNRKDTYLNLLLCASPDAGGVKTFTVNVSQGGAFVHTAEQLAKGSRAWLSVPDMPGEEPVQVTVCWSIAWGGCRSIPGVGVMFDALSEPQGAWLARTIAG